MEGWKEEKKEGRRKDGRKDRRKDGLMNEIGMNE